MNKERIKYLSPAHIICFEEDEYEAQYCKGKKLQVLEICTTETIDGESVKYRIEFEKGKKTPHFLFIKSMLIGALKNPLTCNFVFMIIGEPYDYKIDVTIK